MIKSKQLIEDMSKYSMMVGSRYKFLEFNHVIGFRFFESSHNLMNISIPSH